MVLSSYFTPPDESQYLSIEKMSFQSNLVGPNKLIDCSFLNPCYYEEGNLESSSNFLPSYFSQNHTFPFEDFSSYPYAKHPRHDYCYSGPILNSSCPSSGIPQIPQNGENETENTTNERTVSPQAIAARERRRKITEKTQQLGQLVPSGSKMNTAEMFHAASKYVSFLQAQVKILEYMMSSEKHVEEMKVITSLTIQEKLSSQEKCLVPKELVVALEEQSKPPIAQQLTQLLALQGRNCNKK